MRTASDFDLVIQSAQKVFEARETFLKAADWFISEIQPRDFGAAMKEKLKEFGEVIAAIGEQEERFKAHEKKWAEIFAARSHFNLKRS